MKRKKAFRKQFQQLIYLILCMATITHVKAQGKLNFTSTAFTEGKTIPSKHTCTGQDISPELSWGNAPAGTKSFAIIMDDPDAPMGIWVHWVIYNIPGTVGTLKEGFKTNEIKAVDGLNDWGEKGYRGPCPPDGQHRYRFKLYALDAMLEGAKSTTKENLEEAMKGHILDFVQLTGTFEQ
jgi:Raf kinase inhibitor-like YbhB/YbcL family protein